MNKVLKNPIYPRQRSQEGLKEWNYKAPSYDNRTSDSIRAGNDYGVGFTNPIGLEKASGIDAGPIPFGCKAFSPKEVMREDISG